MEKFYEIFRRDLKTKRLELRVLQPTPENARLVWDVIQNENPGDFKYVNWTADYKKPLPESLDETLKQMQQLFRHRHKWSTIFHQKLHIGYLLH